jgi:DNA polymerase-3 subunit delta'
MARATTVRDAAPTTEPDAIAGVDAPREHTRFVGHAATEEAVLAALASGTLHHALLLGGARGIGKVTFAFRLARFLLAGGDPRSGSLAVDETSHAVRLVNGGAHPDMLVLSRSFNEGTGRFRSEIVVDDVRRLVPFFGSTPALGGWRIALVDAADDLNINAANALLKTLEEPPPRSLFLLVSHAPGRLLATIRSRCRLVRMAPLSGGEVVAGLSAIGLGGEVADTAAARAEGSLRAAILLAAGGDRDVSSLAAGLLDRLPALDRRALGKLADAVGGRDGEAAYTATVALVRDFVARHVRAEASAGAPPAVLAAWAEVWEKVDRAVGRAEALNLDRRQVVLGVFRDLAEAARRG